jgi:hypothetical protein
MSTLLKISLALVVALFTSVIFLNWYYTDDPGKLFLTANFLETASSNIRSLDVDFNDGKVYLNVHLKNPATCKVIMTELGIGNIVLGEKVYAPVCNKVNRNLISIVYSRIIKS